MEKAIASCDYIILDIDDDLNVVTDDGDQDSICYSISQFKGDELEVWKVREDGFIFVYCNRMEIGYWVTPKIIDIQQ